MLTIFFWIAAVLMVYVYAGFPIIVRALARVLDRPVNRAPITPSVTVIVTAYNEEKSIRAKLDNLLSVDYPAELMDVLVASDASSDATDEIVTQYGSPRVALFRVEGRLGKTACQNRAIRRARGEIVIFTDATTELDRDAVKALVANYNDPEVGCVSGRAMYYYSDSLTSRGGASYWEFEHGVRAAESRLGSVIGASGCFYSVRKSAYREIDPALISDFVIALVMVEQGLRTILEPAAISREETLERPNRELSMRVRVALRSITALAAGRRFLNPFKYGLFAWELWSHKVLRYASPLIWLVLLVSSALLLRVHWFYAFALLGQLALLAMGLIAWLLHGRVPKLLVKPYYFLLTNVASLIAISRFLRGDRIAIWQTVR
jgi:cellulose synthase/poly-beta-1,6-N-acetylglucosamine synthase-like glycosyltransferase